jgi:hypothetical protein
MTTAAAATNRVSRPAQSHSSRDVGITVNASIPVGGMEGWLQEAIRKVIKFGNLAQNWDGQGSQAPGLYVRQTALDLLMNVPGLYPPPRVVPVSGGGFHIEWAMGDRELEISIEPNCTIEVLRVEHGMPIESNSSDDLPALFSWLASH